MTAQAAARANGEDVDNEFLGGADTHSGISGVTDYKVKNDHEGEGGSKIATLLSKKDD